jgi:hydroxysqualene synthase
MLMTDLLHRHAGGSRAMPDRPDRETRRAYAQCTRQARAHYENFPVASRLLPTRLRGPVAAIYVFARRADDLADEGDRSAEQRLAALDTLERRLNAAADGHPDDDPGFVALAHAIRTHGLPVSLFRDLLDAFRQDVTKQRYRDFGEVMQYCRRSANPVGRLLLHLVDRTDERSLARSDAICSSLQLINFYQDLSQDYHEMGRIYLPQDEMARFGVTEAHIAQRISDPPMRQLMQLQYERADRLLRAGAPLGAALGGRFGLEIRLITVAGARVLWHLKRQRADIFARPRLRLADYAVILRGALFLARTTATDRGALS